MNGLALQVQVALGTGAGEAALRRIADRVRVPLVIDHMGRPAPDAAPRVLLDLLASGRAWVKLSAAYRISRRPAPEYDDLLPLVAALVAANPEQLVWGSDWPHTELASEVPQTSTLVDLLPAWLPDPATRARICALNPARLYGYDAPVAASRSQP